MIMDQINNSCQRKKHGEHHDERVEDEKTVQFFCVSLGGMRHHKNISSWSVSE